MDENAPSDTSPQKGSASGPCRSFRTTFHIGKLCSNRGKVIGKVIAHRDRTRSRLDGSRFGMSSSSSFNSNHDVNGPRSDVFLQSGLHRCTPVFCQRAGRFLQAMCQSGRIAARCVMARKFVDRCTLPDGPTPERSRHLSGLRWVPQPAVRRYRFVDVGAPSAVHVE